MSQLPMSLNFPGPFNLTGTPGQTYSLVANANGQLEIVQGAGPDSVNLETDVTGILPVANGGTNAANLNALAKSGANSDITSLAGLTTALSSAQGGTGSKLFSVGKATFVSAGSVAVVDTTITANSIIVVTEVTATPLAEEFSVVPTAGVGFTIYSTNPTSTAVVNFIRVN